MPIDWTALTVFILLFVLYWLGLIQPHGILPATAP